MKGFLRRYLSSPTPLCHFLSFLYFLWIHLHHSFLSYLSFPSLLRLKLASMRDKICHSLGQRTAVKALLWTRLQKPILFSLRVPVVFSNVSDELNSKTHQLQILYFSIMDLFQLQLLFFVLFFLNLRYLRTNSLIQMQIHSYTLWRPDVSFLKQTLHVRQSARYTTSVKGRLILAFCRGAVGWRCLCLA